MEITQFEKSFVTTAERIVRGVERGEARILIGRSLDMLARVLHVSY